MTQIETDDIDNKLLEHFKGYVVKKDLVREVKSGANVPAFVLEYLLANHCSTTKKEELDEGIENVKNILRKNYVDPDQSEKVKSDVKQKGTMKVIDRIEAELDTQNDCYWASLNNSNVDQANIPEAKVRYHDKMLTGGFWSIIDLGYDPEIQIKGKRVPFYIDDLKPIQLSSFESSQVADYRDQFTRDEWAKVLLRSVGLEPDAEGMDERTRMLLISRMIPLVENNFNMVELGPRSTGKSYTYKEFSPYSILISGGQASVARLFVNLNTGEIGLVGMWDTVAFDEVAGINFKQDEAIQILKDYMESGSFSRGGSGEQSGKASLVFNGNFNQRIELALKTSHLFSPLPEDLQDTAFLDRIHYYLPGWEIPKYRSEHFTTHFGLSMDYFAEFLSHLRDYNYTNEIKKHFHLGRHLNERDEKAVKKTVSGFLKLFHPDGNFEKQDVRKYLELALEMRRRVKEQLKRLGGMEFWDTNFSYTDQETREEKYVGVPEESSGAMIEEQPLKPGLVYTVSTNRGENTLLKIECTTTEGSGKLSISGTSKKDTKDDIKNVYKYLKSNQKQFLSQHHDLSNYDVTVQLQPLIGDQIGTDIGSAMFIAILSKIHDKNLKQGLGVLGDITLGGAIQRCEKFEDSVATLSENGASHVLAPMDNTEDFANIPKSVHSETDTVFYDSPQTLLQKSFLET